jgi:hypothetical protein
MDFVLITMGMIALIVVVLVLLARAYPGSGADLVDWKPTRSPQVEAELEIDDVQQMIAAQNKMRARRGAEAITEEDVDEMVAKDEQVRQRGRRWQEQPAEEIIVDENEDLGT